MAPARFLWLIAASLVPAIAPAFAPAFASTADMPAPPACPAPVAPAGAYAPWAQPAPLAAGQAADGAPLLKPGSAARLSLAPTPQVRYALRPEKPGGSVSYGGLVALEVASAGTYRIALGSAAWLDVIGKGGALPSIAHGHGPDCTGIRKLVDFTLEPGRYLLQISANGTPALTVMALALP
ncbi:MAG TPA: hypothetical protein VFF98_15025 [Novosphingobium sp.]|nr:hypothetical protein [Novosphingobium sp.]